MKILFITHNRLGDAVLSSCLLNHILTEYPEARVTIAVGSIPAPLFQAIPQVEKLIIVNKLSYERHWLLLWAKTLFKRWNMVIDCRGSAISYLLWTKQRFCHYDKSTKTKHRVERYASLMKLKALPQPKLWLSITAKQRALTLTQDHRSIIAIGPAANWRAKTWPTQNFIKLIQRLTAENGDYANASVMVISAPHERQAIQSILENIPQERLIDLAGTEDLSVIAACLSHCKLFIGNDSGLMHMAAASGIKTLGLFGPTDPVRYAPFGEHCYYVCTTKKPEELMLPGFDHLTSETLMESLDINTVLSNPCLKASQS